MNPARIAELLEPFLDPAGDRPTAGDLERISTYIDILLRWNARINLTAVRDPEHIVTRHFGESLFAARHLFPARVETATLADLGSGAGFPGVPIKLWAPGFALTLIESNGRKASFLRELTRALALTDINVFHGRAEDLAVSFDLVTLRAVERFERALPVAARLLASDGRLALLIGASQVNSARTLLPSFSWCDPLPVPQSTSRVLLLGSRT